MASDKQIQALLKAGFDSTPKPITPALIISTEGAVKAGKTDLGFDMPDPILCQSLDYGHDGIVQKWQERGKTIVNKLYPYNIPQGLKDKPEFTEAGKHIRKTVWDPFEDDFRRAVEGKLVRSVVWDTATEVYELQRLSHHGKIQQIAKEAYGIIYAEYKELVRLAKANGISMLLIHHMGDVWEDYVDNKGEKRSRKTGKMQRKGISKVDAIVDAFVEQRFIPATKLPDGSIKDEARFELEIIRSRMSPGMVGTVLEDDPSSSIDERSIRFSSLAGMLAPEIPGEAWE